MTSVFTLVLSFDDYCLLLVVFYYSLLFIKWLLFLYYYCCCVFFDISFIIGNHGNVSCHIVICHQTFYSFRHEDLKISQCIMQIMSESFCQHGCVQNHRHMARIVRQVRKYRYRMDTQGQVGFSSAGRLHRLVGVTMICAQQKFSRPTNHRDARNFCCFI